MKTVRDLSLPHMAMLLVMAASGFIPWLASGSVGGYVLLLHTAGGGLYALALTLVALRPAVDTSACSWINIAYGLLLWSGGLTVLTMLLAMTWWFGTDWQHWLLAAHRWSALCALLAGFAYHIMAFTGHQTCPKPEGDPSP